MRERVLDIVFRLGKNFGYVGLGCAIIGLIEVGVFTEMVFCLIAAIFIIAMYSIEIRRRECSERWVGRKFASVVLERPIKKSELEGVDMIIDRLGDEIWDLCATNEDKEKCGCRTCRRNTNGLF